MKAIRFVGGCPFVKEVVDLFHPRHFEGVYSLNSSSFILNSV